MAYEDLFAKVGREFGVDWRLLAEVGWLESRHNPRAVGRAGEYGLMQIMPGTWNEWAPKVGVSDPFDPESNVRVSAAYLAWLAEQLARVGRRERYWALVAYNWGIGNVLRLLKSDGKWRDVPPERQEYANEIALKTQVRVLAGD
jgi:membrane-bound lytic murein transglycosylase F